MYSMRIGTVSSNGGLWPFSRYTEEENFSAADAVFDCIGDPPTANFDLGFAASLLGLRADAVA